MLRLRQRPDQITTRNGIQLETMVFGTSFSAPQIVGAVALVAQAFPNMTGQAIVDLLLRTARDGGAAGIDRIYGCGTLDIANAFAPQGTMTLAGSSALVPLRETMLVTSGAMGDAGSKSARLLGRFCAAAARRDDPAAADQRAGRAVALRRGG